ncbi:type VI secretion system ATPase TssH [Paraburkholderia caffeinilytica]|uniref:type VI secretion system ATPase TssH n=1 Tax=Paraburkholderia caffeinilytica TaxID=1761016 RepID=UPI003D9FE61F
MTISRETLFGKLGKTPYASIESAVELCRARGNPYIEIAHWLLQMLQVTRSDLIEIIRYAELDYTRVDRELRNSIDRFPRGSASVQDFSWDIELVIERAWVIATLSHQDTRIRGAWLICALTSTPELSRVLRAVSPTLSRLCDTDLDSAVVNWISQSNETSEHANDGSGQPDKKLNLNLLSPEPAWQTTIDQYCVDLTEQARLGKIDPVIGRQIDIRALTDVLLRRKQNNPLLTGEAGVGKTAIVEGLALAIASGRIPEALAHASLMSLDVGALIAGAGMKGEFEARLKAVIEAITCSDTPVILFIDEIHTLIGAGGQAGTGDAANLLKPALARGTLRTIGATTWSEYKRYIEKDPALTRRFQMLQIREPSESVAVDMVRSLASRFGEHHGVTIRDEAIHAAVKLSHRYIPSRQLPDKAISLLDTACARVALSLKAEPTELAIGREQLTSARTTRDLLEQHLCLGFDVTESLDQAHARVTILEGRCGEIETSWRQQRQQAQILLAQRERVLRALPQGNCTEETPEASGAQVSDNTLVLTEVDETVVAQVVSDLTGVPAGRLTSNEIDRVRTLAQTLAARVIGQNAALDQISEKIRTARAGLGAPDKPAGVFLLVGPSGVGKTETALALAEALYGGDQNLVVVNMSEYQEAHSVSGLKGAPPGYVGFGEGGVLTEAVRRQPWSVVLLDEIDKAHRDVWEIFYQVFDKGYMEDADGRYIDFRHTVILMASNVGASVLTHARGDADDIPQSALHHELRQVFDVAFLGRVTVVPYHSLLPEALVSIAQLHLHQIGTRLLEKHGIKLCVDDGLADYIAAHSLTGPNGAREITSFIEQQILPQLSILWLDAQAARQPLERISITVVDASQPPAHALSIYVTERATVSPSLNIEHPPLVS